MENLEEVVRERNRAYYELETGTTGTVPITYMYLSLTSVLQPAIQNFLIAKGTVGKSSFKSSSKNVISDN
jgi:hypothetical protein